MGAALNWVQSPNNYQGGWGASFSYVIGTDGSKGTVLDDDQMPTYSSGYGGPGSTYAIDEYGISYELAQSAAQEPFTDACLRRAAKEIAAKCKQYGIPAVFLTIPNQRGVVPTGLVRHDRCQNGYVLGKSDPGDQFNEGAFLNLLRLELQVPQDVQSPLEQEQEQGEEGEEEEMLIIYKVMRDGREIGQEAAFGPFRVQMNPTWLGVLMKQPHMVIEVSEAELASVEVYRGP